MNLSGALLWGRRAACFAAIVSCLSTAAQQSRPDLAGMWSDPPATIEDTFCLFFCTQAGLDNLEALLADEASDDRPIPDLFAEAATFQLETYLKPRLTPEAVATLGLDPADDPGFLECEPWAFAREIFAPHQLEIEQLADRVEMLYGEWTVRRTVFLDGRRPPARQAATPMGHSMGRYEDGALIIETSVRPHLRREHNRHRRGRRYGVPARQSARPDVDRRDGLIPHVLPEQTPRRLADD